MLLRGGGGGGGGGFYSSVGTDYSFISFLRQASVSGCIHHLPPIPQPLHHPDHMGVSPRQQRHHHKLLRGGLPLLFLLLPIMLHLRGRGRAFSLSARHLVHTQPNLHDLHQCLQQCRWKHCICVLLQIPRNRYRGLL